MKKTLKEILHTVVNTLLFRDRSWVEYWSKGGDDSFSFKLKDESESRFADKSEENKNPKE